MKFQNIEEEVATLKEKVEKVEDKEGVERRMEEIRIFKPADFSTDYKAKEIQYYKTVKLFFDSEDFFRTYLKHFNVSEFIEPNSHHLEPLMLFLKLLEEGIIKQEQAGNKTVFKVKGGEYVYESATKFW